MLVRSVPLAVLAALALLAGAACHDNSVRPPPSMPPVAPAAVSAAPAASVAAPCDDAHADPAGTCER